MRPFTPRGSQCPRASPRILSTHLTLLPCCCAHRPQPSPSPCAVPFRFFLLLLFLFCCCFCPSINSFRSQCSCIERLTRIGVDMCVSPPRKCWLTCWWHNPKHSSTTKKRLKCGQTCWTKRSVIRKGATLALFLCCGPTVLDSREIFGRTHAAISNGAAGLVGCLVATHSSACCSSGCDLKDSIGATSVPNSSRLVLMAAHA